MAVAEVNIADLQDGDRFGVLLLAAVLFELFLQLHDDEGQIVPDVVRAPDDHDPPENRGRNHDDQHRRPDPHNAVEEGRQNGAAGRTDEEDIDAAHCAHHATQAVWRDRGEDGTDHGESRQEQDGTRHAEDGPEDRVGHEVLNGNDDRDGQDDLADQRQGLGRILAVETVVVPADEGQRDEHPDGADGADDAALERIEPELLLEIQVAQHGSREEPEADGGEGDQDRLDRADAHDPLEGCFERGRGRRCVPEDIPRARPSSRTARGAAQECERRRPPPATWGWPGCRRPSANRRGLPPRWR